MDSKTGEWAAVWLKRGLLGAAVMGVVAAPRPAAAAPAASAAGELANVWSAGLRAYERRAYVEARTVLELGLRQARSDGLRVGAEVGRVLVLQAAVGHAIDGDEAALRAGLRAALDADPGVTLPKAVKSKPVAAALAAAKGELNDKDGSIEHLEPYSLHCGQEAVLEAIVTTPPSGTVTVHWGQDGKPSAPQRMVVKDGVARTKISLRAKSTSPLTYYIVVANRGGATVASAADAAKPYTVAVKCQGIVMAPEWDPEPALPVVRPPAAVSEPTTPAPAKPTTPAPVPAQPPAPTAAPVAKAPAPTDTAGETAVAKPAAPPAAAATPTPAAVAVVTDAAPTPAPAEKQPVVGPEPLPAVTVPTDSADDLQQADEERLGSAKFTMGVLLPLGVGMAVTSAVLLGTSTRIHRPSCVVESSDCGSIEYVVSTGKVAGGAVTGLVGAVLLGTGSVYAAKFAYLQSGRSRDPRARAKARTDVTATARVLVVTGAVTGLTGVGLIVAGQVMWTAADYDSENYGAIERLNRAGFAMVPLGVAAVAVTAGLVHGRNREFGSEGARVSGLNVAPLLLRGGGGLGASFRF